MAMAGSVVYVGPLGSGNIAKLANQDIPQAHKIALCDIPKNGAVIRCGVTLGYAKEPIQKGDWINEHMLHLPESPSLKHMHMEQILWIFASCQSLRAQRGWDIQMKTGLQGRGIFLVL